MSEQQSFQIALGIEFTSAPDLQSSLETARNSNIYDFIAVPLVHPRNERLLIGQNVKSEPFTRSDMLLNSSQWNSYVVGKISPWLDMDSKNEETRRNSIKVFKQEMAWASHLSLPAVILPTPRFLSANYAQNINSVLQNLMYLHLWIRIPLVSPQNLISDESETKKELSINNRSETDSWEWWNNVRTLCEQHPQLGVALEITEDLPEDQILAKWLGEPVRALIIPTKIFLTNKAGYPALSKKHQHFITSFFKFKVQYIIKGNSRHQQGGLRAYQEYMRFLASKNPPFANADPSEVPYMDYLQAPLQPLMDNLESQTYETFERDQTKYDQYQQAVYKALLQKPENSTTVLMVVGAGRGPLVRASLRASVDSKRDIRVYAVEKNPNAVITLKNMKVSLNWGDQVTIVDSDMRVWDAPEKADILVSELLGSFGDNELSPECLDGAQRFLKEDGISIPSSYTSFVAPICSPKLWNEVKSYKDLAHFETAYVVKLHNIHQLAEPQECFTFVHPNKENPIDNSRYKTLQFKIPFSSTIHGFAGYFDSVLYDDVHLGIHPTTHTPNMFSWFPIYFPLRDPMYVPENSTIEVHFWRVCGRTKVWYEWATTSPDNSPVHNPNGRSYWIGL